MIERPISFKSEMVEAILAGRKSQTRRLIKPQPDFEVPDGRRLGIAQYLSAKVDNSTKWYTWDESSKRHPDQGRPLGEPFYCPYGQTGDKLIVIVGTQSFKLQITAVHVERIKDINTRDAQYEGADYMPPQPVRGVREGDEMISAFRRYWYSLYSDGEFGWLANPWVWVIEFRPVFLVADSLR